MTDKVRSMTPEETDAYERGYEDGLNVAIAALPWSEAVALKGILGQLRENAEAE